ncbi:type VI secretion system Vgr family protein [Xanthobacteraceae bacterium A53D]
MATPIDLKILLNIAGLELRNYAAESLVGQEAISELYRFEVSFNHQDDFSARSISGQPAWIRVIANDRSTYIAGVVLEFRVKDRTATKENHTYGVVIGPRLSLLNYSKQTEVFATENSLSCKGVLEGILQDSLSVGSTLGGHGQELKYDFSGNVSDKFHRSNITKYNETDFEFFSRTASEYGIHFSVVADESGDDYQDKVWLGERNVDFPLGPTVVYRDPSTTLAPGAAAVVSFAKVERPQIRSVHLRDYNAEKPDGDMLASSTARAGGVGAIVEFGAHYPTKDEGDSIAKMRADELACQAVVFEGESNDPEMRAGYTFTLQDHHVEKFNVKYILVSVEHSAACSAPIGFSNSIAQSKYRNRFVAVPWTQQFRPRRQIPRPVMAGVFNAMVDAAAHQQPETAADGTTQTVTSEPKRAVLEADGSYRVTFRYNEGATRADGKAGKRSSPVRQLQPHASSRDANLPSGLHMPLVKTTEVLMAYVNGDPDRPIIVGAAHNGNNPNTLTNASQTLNRFCTPGGTLLEMEDGGDDGVGRYLRLDVPAAANGDVPTGTYLRLGKTTDDEGSGASDGTEVSARTAGAQTPSIKSQLGYTTSTTASETNDPWSDSNRGYKDEKGDGKGTTHKTTSLVAKLNHAPSGNGVLLYTAEDMDVNVVGTATMKYGIGYTTEVTEADSTHTVKAGHYLLQTRNGVKITAGKMGGDGPATDIVLHAKGAIKQTSDGPTSLWTFGKLEKYTVGQSFSMFLGTEETVKASLSVTAQLAGTVSLTIGIAVGTTIGVKTDMIIGTSSKFVIGSDYKYALTDQKILAGNDLKMAINDTKFLSGYDAKVCSFSYSREVLKDDVILTENKEKLIESLTSKLSSMNRKLHNEFVTSFVVS